MYNTFFIIYTYSSVVLASSVLHPDSLPVHLDQPLNKLSDDVDESQLTHLSVIH